MFSAARPNQEGLGHIAERPQEEWIDEFKARGMVYLWRVTSLLRRVCDRRNKNHQKNVLVFTWPSSPFASDDSTVLSRQIVLPRNEDRPDQLWPELQTMANTHCS